MTVTLTSHEILVKPVGAMKAGDWIATGVLGNKVQVSTITFGMPVVLHLADGTKREFFEPDHKLTVWRPR